MGRKPKISVEQKLEAVKKYLNNEGSLASISTVYAVNHETLRSWIINYESLGIEGISQRKTHNKYSACFKNQVVKAYLNGEGSFMDLAKKFKVPSKGTIVEWVMKYNSHEQLKSSCTGGATIMTKGRKTTFEERVKIVEYCIEHENNYTETAQKFEVSYQQVFSWVSKYEKNGVDALKDRRGKRKSVDEMTEIEKLRAENKLLRAKERKQQMEIDFLKKLEEIERRRS